jgi:hypothetical protein
MVELVPVGPGVPESLRPVLKSLQDAVRALQNPEAPQPAFAIAQASLPPAAAYPNSIVLITDLGVLAHSDGLHWIREDTGAPI